jgi:hypothetical protein
MGSIGHKAAGSVAASDQTRCLSLREKIIDR